MLYWWPPPAQVWPAGQFELPETHSMDFCRLEIHLLFPAGAPLVPVFVFGQTDAYSWVKLGPPFFPQGLTQQIARSIGFLPLLMSGVWGTPVPHKVPSIPLPIT